MIQTAIKPTIEPFTTEMVKWILFYIKDAHRERYDLNKLNNQAYAPYRKTYDKDALREDLRDVLNTVHLIVGEEPISQEVKEKVLRELFYTDKMYYYNKNRKPPKNYKTERLWDDLEFVLNHIQFR